MKRILLTGSSGMVGSNLTQMFHENLYEKFELLTPNSTELNLISYECTLESIRAAKPDIVIHAAGLVGGIQSNMINNSGYLNSNLLMGFNLINACLESDIEYVINIASSCIYPSDKLTPLKEDDLLSNKLEPTNEGYALAKISVLKYCEFISKEYSRCYKTLIPCNLYGRYDKFDTKVSHLVPAVIAKITKAKSTQENEVEIWGDGSARREFMYASDFADLFRHVLVNEILDELPLIMNVGTGIDYTIKEYYSTAAEVIGFIPRYVYDLDKPVGMKRKLLDTSLQSSIGWEPKYSLKEGILETYNFYKRNILSK